jgi:hypothetical protein
MHRFISKLLVAAFVAATACLSHAQVSYTGGVYGQNFNTLAGTTNNTANLTWTDNSTLPGWYANKTTFSVTDGTLGGSASAFSPTAAANTNNVGLFSFGTASSSDRALGSRATSAVSGNNPVLYGVRLVNNTTQTLTSFTVTYTGEQWFKSGKTTADTLLMDYQIGASSISAGTWTAATGATFTSPINTSTAATVAGNTAANRKGIAVKVTGVSWAPGTELWIRFRDTDDTGDEQGLAVDDFYFFAENESGVFFNGSTSYITMGFGSGTVATLGASSFTLECRFMRTGPGVTASTGTGGVTANPLIAKGVGEADGTNVDANYFLGIDANGKLVADFEQLNATNNGTAYAAGQNFPVTGSTTLQDGVFYHVAATYDTATATWKLYVNGVPETVTLTIPTFVGVVPRNDNIQGLGIGTTINSTGARAGFFQGVIDEVRIWNVARSASEILANKDQKIATGTTGLLARYGFDEATGTTAAGINAAGTAAPAGTLSGTQLPVWVNSPAFVPNVAPTVTLTSPTASYSGTFPATVSFAATAADSDGTIAKVEFYNGATKLGEDLAAPYAFDWTGVSAGTYTLTSVATDNSGATTTSDPVTITVSPNSNQPTVVTPAGPANNATGIGSSTTLDLALADGEGDALTVTYYGRNTAPATPAADFSVIAIPDTQFYSENTHSHVVNGSVGANESLFYAQTQWIADNQAARKIAFVSHMGDIAQNGDTYQSEWIVADTAMKIIENPATTLRAHGIPWGVAPGNHDQQPIGDAGGTTNYYTQYFNFTRWDNRPYYGGHFGNKSGAAANTNNYELFSAGGLDFIVVHMEYDIRAKSFYQPVLDWADALLKAFPNRRAIITSHWIVNTGNPATFSTQGQDIYNALKNNPNLFLMLCGHVNGEGMRSDTYNGHTVYSVLQDYQEIANGGNGFLRIYTFSPANNTITLESYSPTLNRAINSGDGVPSGNYTPIVLPYDMQSAVTDWIPLGTVNVAAGGTTAPLNWTGLEAGKNYEWYAVVSDGVNTTTTATRRFATAAASAPAVTLTSPANGANYGLPATITLTADASDTDGTIARVEFFNGGTKLGEATSAPYTYTWSNVPAGSYALTAVATDNSGLDAVSAVATVTVTNAAPTVTLTAPGNAATFDAPAAITLAADAADTDGTVAKVEFFNGATKLGEATSAPYQFNWANVVTGTYALTAKVTDDQGATTTSAVVNVTVTNVDNAAPTVALTAPGSSVTIAAGGSYTLAATAADTDGSIVKVEFYNGATKLGEDTSAPYTYAWTGITAGTYTVTAIATDNDGGTTTSAPATVVSDPSLWSYTQNFDGLGTGTSLTALSGWSFYGALGGANTTWTDSIPIPATAIGGGTLNNTLTAATTFTTSSNTAGFNFALPASTSDRALGTSPTSGQGVVLQLSLTNTTGTSISALRIGYDIRRFTAPATANELPGYWLFYSVNNGTTWTNVSALNPTVAGPTGVIVPNTVGVTTVAPTVFSLSSPWAAGATILFRWVDDNAVATSPDQIVGLDNLTIGLPVGQAPTVSLTAPANGSVLVSPATVNLAATAADSDGTIAKVEFYSGSTKLGETSTAPYTFTATGVTTGTYTYTAVATDNDGNAITSAGATVTVNATAGSGTLQRGPYLNMANENSIVVRWRSSQAVVGRVRYGLASGTLDQFTDETSAKTDHEIRLTGLTPYTRYYYSVGSAADALTPETVDTTSVRSGAYTFPTPTAADYTFRTSPVPGTATNTRIWVVGDCGRGSATQAAGRDAYYNWMGSHVPDLNLQMGDNAYNSGTDTEYQTGYWLMYPTIFRKLPQWSCVGNHDANNGDTSPTANWPYYDMFTFPTAGEAGGVASGTEHYYSFNYGNIHFISLDSQASSTNTIEANGADGPMAAWLRQDLAANTATWTIVFFHHPPYSKGSHNSDTETQMVNMRVRFNPILEAGGVDLVLNGHSHNYERSVLLDGHYGISSTITSAMKLNAGNGSTTGFTTAFTTAGDSGKIRNAANGFVATATVNGAVIPPDGAYIKPLTGPRDHFGTVYNVAGMSGQADGGSLDHAAMYISYDTVGTVNLDINGNTLVATYVQADGNTPDNYTIIKQGAADTDADGIPDAYELANGLNRSSAADADLDLDGDGLSNRLEYALGTAANSPNRTGLPVLGQGAGADAGKLTLTFNRAQSELTYIVQASDDLKTWSTLATNPGTAGTSVTVTDTNTASPNRYLRLRVTDGVAAVTTTPVGRMTATLGQGQEIPIAFPLNTAIGSITGQPAGFITAVGTNTLDNASAGWTDGALSQAATPYLVRIISGPAAGLVLPVSTTTPNTATRLTLVTGGLDLTTLGISPGVDSYELVPADTLETLFPGSTLKTGDDINTADSLRMWNGSTWIYYFNNGSGWQRSGVGAAPNTLVRPDRGWILKRVGPTRTFVEYGQVSPVSARLSVSRSANTFVAPLPISTTFDELALQTALPGWSSNAANPAAGDQVRIWNGSTWLVYVYASGSWSRVGVAGSAGSTVLAKPGRPFLIVRPTGSGTDLLLHQKSY